MPKVVRNTNKKTASKTTATNAGNLGGATGTPSTPEPGEPQNGGSPEDPIELRFVTLAQNLPICTSSYTGGEVVVKSQGDLEWLWKQMFPSSFFSSAAPPIPKIDFNNYMLIAIVGGMVDYVGDKYYIYRVMECTNGEGIRELKIDSQYIASGDTCPKIQCKHHDYHIIYLKRSDLPIHFFHSGPAVMDCTSYLEG